MKVFRLLILVWAVGHLLLVYCAAFALPPCCEENPAAQMIAYYQHLTGSGYGFSFFAPSVFPEHRATFIMTDEKGQTWSEELSGKDRQEVQIHMHNIVGRITEETMEEDVAVSWAALMFDRHPQAREIVVKVEYRRLPSLEEYRQGDPGRWITTFEAAYVRPGQVNFVEEQ